MTRAIGASRTTRTFHSSRSPLTALALGAMGFLLAVAGGAADAPAALSPTLLAANASATPGLQMPAGEPQKLVMQAAPAGTEEPSKGRGEGKVAAGKPVVFLLQAASAGLYSIGVSSPQNVARLTIYRSDSKVAESGTSLESGAIRWSSELKAAEAVRIVIHTAGTEVPFRVEAIADAGSM